MPREFIQELRGDMRNEAADVDYHIDKKELRESYLACIPQLGFEDLLIPRIIATSFDDQGGPSVWACRIPSQSG